MEIGKKLADALGIPFYDNELITIAAQKSGYAEDLFAGEEDRPISRLLYSNTMFGAGTGAAAMDLPLGDKVFLIQSEIIKEVAARGGCVIVGRCADYVLRENPNCVNIFVHAGLKSRIDWVVREMGMTPEKAKDFVQRTDKRRAAYYNYYTGKKFGISENYDLCLNSGILGRDGSVGVIKAFVEMIDQNEK